MTAETTLTSNMKQRLKHMREQLGGKPEVEMGEFVNWAKTRQIEQLLCCSPCNLEEVQAVVKVAKQLKLRVRCTGAGHSWAPLFPDEGNVLMRMENLHCHDGPQIELKKENGKNYVTVMSGVTVGKLRRFELKHKVNLPCNVILNDPTIGGVVAAGCHGVGWNNDAIPDYVVRMQIVDSNGKLREYDRESDPDLFRAVQTNLGLFGVIYKMTFVIPDQIMVDVKNDFQHSTKDLFYTPGYLKDLVRSNESVEIFWWPFNSVSWCDTFWQFLALIPFYRPKLTPDRWNAKNDNTFVKIINEKKKRFDYHKDHNQHLRHRTWYESKAVSCLEWFLVKCPRSFTAFFEKASFKWLERTTEKVWDQQLPHAIHYRPNIAIMSVEDMEFCFKVEEDFSTVLNVCKETIELVQEYAEDGEFPLNVAMEMRFMANSQAYLCPAHIGSTEHGGTGHTCYIEVLSYTNTPGWKKFCDDLFQRWKKYTPTVHWAKQWDFLDGGRDYMREINKEQAKIFREQLDKSGADPSGMFKNNMLDDVLFDGGEVSDSENKKEK